MIRLLKIKFIFSLIYQREGKLLKVIKLNELDGLKFKI
jgi:hypothetical protein